MSQFVTACKFNQNIESDSSSSSTPPDTPPNVIDPDPVVEKVCDNTILNDFGGGEGTS